VPADEVAGDVYHVDLTMNGSQQNTDKTMTLTIGFDPDQVPDANINDLAVVQWNEETQTWDLVDGAVMVDAMSNTCSVEVESITNAATSSSARSSRQVAKAKFNGKEYIVDKHAPITSDQSGIFMVVRSETGLEVFNVPNPFNLKSKTVPLNQSDQQITTIGTVIRFAVPSSMGNDIDTEFRIYNIAGELVRKIMVSDEIDGNVDGGYYYYIAWDGKNDDGDKCASGVYFLYCDVGHKKKIVKMALIK